MATDVERADDAIRITFTGVDRPGITAELAGLLAEAGATLLDIEQVVVEERLNLNFLVALEGGENGSRPVLKEVLWKARELGLHVDFDLAPRVRQRSADKPVWALTVIANPIDVRLLATLSQTTARAGFNIERIHRLSHKTLTSAEFSLSGECGEPERALRAGLMKLRAEFQCDLALQRETLTRRSKRLIVMDMDSTLIQQEVIDELAVSLGVQDKVSAITHRAMNGELDFDQSLRERVRLLKGTPESALVQVLERIHLTPGAEELVRVLKRLGYRTAVISGGFIEVVEPIQKRLGLDYAYANRLEVKDGLLTGEVLGTIVNRQRKAELLVSIAQTERIGIDQVIAVGDGANDLDMLHRAGLGIAFNAKRTVQEQAQAAINQTSLMSILYLLGIRDIDTLSIGEH
ncbi:MAG: phosphoserine phosphatase SerB [Myxococcales bacterium]